MKPVNRYVVLAWGTLTLLMLGVVYGWSKFAPAIGRDFGYDQAQITLPYTLCHIALALGILADGWIAKRMPPRFSAILGAAMAGAGFVLSSFVSPRAPFVIYITYGVLVGFGGGLTYNVWLNAVAEWFPDKRGFASGVILLGMGVSGLTLVPLAAIWLNALGWRAAFRILGALMFVEGMLSQLFLLSPPKREIGGQIEESPINLTLVQVVRQPSFWTYTVWKVVLMGAGLAYAGQTATMAADLRAGDALQTMAVSMFSIGNGCSRPLVGWMSDRIGLIRSMALLAAASLAAALGMSFGYPGGQLALLLAGLTVAGVCYGGATAIAPAYMSDAYGTRYYRQTMGVNALTVFPISLGASSAISLVKTATGTYTLFIWALVPLSVLALAMAPVSARSIEKMRAKFGAR